MVKFDAISSQALADRVRLLQSSNKIKNLREFAEEAKVTFANIRAEHGFSQRFSRWLRHPQSNAHVLGEDNYQRLVDHITKLYPYMAAQIRIPLLHLLQKPLYHAIAPLLRCEARGAARQTLIEKMQGFYAIYRPSMRQKQYGYIGAMELRYDEGTDAFTTRELYRRHEDEHWDIPGALYPLSKDVFMITSIDTVDDTVQIKYINDIHTDRSGAITLFSGWIADMDRYKYYTCPIVFKRNNDTSITSLDSMLLDFVLCENMPQFAIEWFGRVLSDQTERGEYIYTEA